jgi:hypothetical protein
MLSWDAFSKKILTLSIGTGAGIDTGAVIASRNGCDVATPKQCVVRPTLPVLNIETQKIISIYLVELV